MNFRHLLVLAAAPLCAQTAAPDPDEPLDITSLISAAYFEAMQSSGMDFDDSPVGLDHSGLEFGTFLHRPIRLGDRHQLLTYAEYEANFLRVDGAPPAFPIGDEDLHELGVSFFLFQLENDTPWVHGIWINPSLNTDFQHVDGDDVFLDVAGGIGYRFSDHLTIGLGIAALNVTGDTEIYPVPGLVWQHTPDWLTLAYGDTLTSTYQVNDCWRLQFEIRPNGGIWNTDTAVGSRNIDFDSYRAGLVTSHRLTEHLWLSVGGGFTFLNELQLTNGDGSRIAPATLGDLDSGYYGFVSLNLADW